MIPRDFLSLAESLAKGGGAAERRSAVSRAYYAVYNVGEAFLEQMGFLPPRRDYHIRLQHRLLNSGDGDVAKIGSDLGNFHLRRNAGQYRTIPHFSLRGAHTRNMSISLRSES